MINKLSIMGHEIKVRHVAPSDGALGECSVRNLEIKINPDQDEEMKWLTLMHEITHMIADLTSIHLTEQSVDGFALGLKSLLRDNPNLIRAIRKG